MFQHSQHTFKPLEEVYDANIVEITEQVAKLQRRHVELISLVQDVVSDDVLFDIDTFIRNKADLF